MKIYTAIIHGEKKQKCIDLNLGCMISADRKYLSKSVLGYSFYAVDNGAYSSYVQKMPFDEHRFLKTLSGVIKLKITPDFIVLPDIIGAEKESLEFSKFWLNRLGKYNNWAIAVQKGCDFADVEYFLPHVSTIFWGSPDDEKFKWDVENIEKWLSFAKKYGKKFHVGATGTVDKLDLCRSIGVDSVDSTSFAVNGSFHKIEKHRKSEQATFI